MWSGVEYETDRGEARMPDARPAFVTTIVDQPEFERHNLCVVTQREPAVKGGALIPLIEVLDGMPRTATATAMMRTELSIIKRDQFVSLLGTEPQLAGHLIKLLCTRVRWTAQLMEDSALLSVPARIAKRLLSLADLHGRETVAGIKLVISQEELAQFLGVSRQIVNQHLQTWKSKGWIQLGRGSVTVCSVRSLETLIRES
jgi:CRP/FNR family transcriptional regulator, cyclic AMP receptor protein